MFENMEALRLLKTVLFENMEPLRTLKTVLFENMMPLRILNAPLFPNIPHAPFLMLHSVLMLSTGFAFAALQFW